MHVDVAPDYFGTCFHTSYLRSGLASRVPSKLVPAHITYRVRFSFGGGEEQLNFLPFEMCGASESYREGGREVRKTKPSETLHTIWRMPAEGDGGGLAGWSLTSTTHIWYY